MKYFEDLVEKLFLVFDDPVLQTNFEVIVSKISLKRRHEADETVIHIIEKLSVANWFIMIQIQKLKRFFINIAFTFYALFGIAVN